VETNVIIYDDIFKNVTILLLIFFIVTLLKKKKIYIYIYIYIYILTFLINVTKEMSSLLANVVPYV